MIGKKVSHKKIRGKQVTDKLILYKSPTSKWERNKLIFR